MSKRTIAKIPISPGTPARVEDFRYVDQGLEYNMQNEYDLRDDHLQASRVINWEIFGEAALGLSGWTPGDSLKLYVTAFELFATEGLCYIGGRSYVLTANTELFDAETPATNTYNIYLKYTLDSNEFAYEYTTSTLTDTHLIKYLLLGTALYTTAVGWSDVVDKRASNTALGAPATVSGSDVGPIFTVENTGAGLGLLVRLSDAQIGEDGTPQILTIWGTSTTGLTLKESGTTNTIVLSCDAAGRMKVAGDINITGTVTSGTWQGTDIAAAYLGDHSHTSVDQGGDYAWADITGGITSTPADTATTTAIDANWAYDHAVGETVNLHTKVGTIGTGVWQGDAVANSYVAGLDQNCLQASSPTFVNVLSTGYVDTDYARFSTTPAATGSRMSVGMSGAGTFRIMEPTGYYLDIKCEALVTTLTSSGSSVKIDDSLSVTGNIRLATSQSIEAVNTTGIYCGTADNFFDHMYAATYYYRTDSTLQSFDHLDDIALIESIGPKRGKKGEADVSAMPKEILHKKGFLDSGNMSMLLAGGIKQMSGRMKELEDLVGVLMDEIKELKKHNAS